MPNQTTATASLHALTERLASQSRSSSIHSFINSGSISLPLPPNFPSPQALAHAASAYRQPAPPPSLPSIQIQGRHQEPIVPDSNNRETGVGVVRCQDGRAWQEKNRHASERLNRFTEKEIDNFVNDMGMILRKEYDCWVEQCWQEAFHHLFIHTLPNLIIHLIMTGSTPSFLRKKIVYGGQQLDHLFQSQMLHLLYEELEKRLSGSRPHFEAGPSNQNKLSPLTMTSPSPSPAPAPAPTSTSSNNTSLYRDGICFHNLSYNHGIPEEEDNHGPCLCQLTTCLNCFSKNAKSRKGPISLLPYELKSISRVSNGWLGGIESEDQAKLRQDSLRRKPDSKSTIPQGKGFIQNSKITNTTINKVVRGPSIFPHPQMTDVLAVEEHLRWRLKEMGARDPAVESRYGPSTNNPIALDGIDLNLPQQPQPQSQSMDDSISEDGSTKSNGPPSKASGGKIKVAKGRGGKLRKMIINPNGTIPKSNKDGSNNSKDGKKAIVYLPKEWTEEDASQRNTAIVLTFRHFVKLLHQISTAASPFSYPSYAKDIEELQRVHPIALYRRIAEPSVQRREDANELKAWQGCMDKWAEELGGKERKRGNEHSNDKNHYEAVKSYTRAISLDGKKTVYYSNRAIAYNNLGEFEKSEQDCNYLLVKDPKNQKALYQRAISRKGMGKLKLAEMDLEELLKQTDLNSANTTNTTNGPGNGAGTGTGLGNTAGAVVNSGNESARHLRNSLYTR